MIHATFKARTGNGPIADAVIHFSDGPLAEFCLEGFSIWRGKDGKPYASVPSREYADKATGEKKRWELLRFEGQGDAKWGFKNWLVAEYERFAGGDSDSAPF